MSTPGGVNVPRLVNAAKEFELQRPDQPLSNMARSRNYIFAATGDRTVNPELGPLTVDFTTTL